MTEITADGMKTIRTMEALLHGERIELQDSQGKKRIFFMKDNQVWVVTKNLITKQEVAVEPHLSINSFFSRIVTLPE